MKKSRIKLETWQLLFVVAASAFAVVFLNSLAYGFSPATVADSLIYTFFIGSSVCLGVIYLAPKIYKLSLAKRTSIIALEIFGATFFGIILTRLFLNALGLEKSILPGFRTSVFSLVISYTFGFSAYFYLDSQSKLRRTERLLRQKELDEARARSLAVQAQLASLESRIQPHFLFNTLNSIAALIRENPEKAEKMVEKLSALLRYSLDFKPNKLVALREELKITKDYLEIEAARFAEKLDYNFNIAPDLEDEKLPAFALQTLVENSIKHVAAKRSAKTEIAISVFNSDGSLKIEVSDNGFGFSENEIRTGHGLDTLQKRLRNIFGDRADLEIIENKTGGRVRLRIPAD